MFASDLKECFWWYQVPCVTKSALSMRAATPANTQYVVDAGLAAAPLSAPLTMPAGAPSVPGSGAAR